MFFTLGAVAVGRQAGAVGATVGVIGRGAWFPARALNLPKGQLHYFNATNRFAPEESER